MKYISGAVDKVRRQEHKELRKEGRDDLNPSSQFHSDIKIRISPNPIFGRFFFEGP